MHPSPRNAQNPRLAGTIGMALAALLAATFATAPRPATAQDAAAAPLLTPHGSFFSRFETRRNYSLAPSGSDFVRYRARLALDVGPIELPEGWTVAARFAPQAGGYWHIGGDGLEDPVLGLHEGALTVGNTAFRVQIGRFEMAYGEHLVIGNVDWHHLGRAFDGARLHLTPADDGRYLDVFFTTVAEGFAGIALPSTEVTPVGDPFGAGDEYFAGLYAGIGPALGLAGAGEALDGYVLARIAPGTQVTEVGTAAELTLGARYRGSAGGLDWRAEVGYQLGARRAATPGGDNPSVSAGQIDAELGYRPGESGFRVSLGGFYASGDDPATADTAEGWDQLFPTAHKWLGYMDFIGARSNVTGAALHLAYDHGAHWKLRLDAHGFLRPEVADGVDAFQGVEVDAGVLYALGGGFTTRLGYGLFAPNADAGLGDELLHFTELEARFDF